MGRRRHWFRNAQPESPSSDPWSGEAPSNTPWSAQGPSSTWPVGGLSKGPWSREALSSNPWPSWSDGTQPDWSDNCMKPGSWTVLPHSVGYDTKRLCVKNMPQKVSRHEVLRTFEIFGRVKDVNLIRNKENGLLRDFCFVTFREEPAAQRALEASGSGSVWVGLRMVSVEPARPRLGHLLCSSTPLVTPPAAGLAPATRKRRRRGCARPPGWCHVDLLPPELLELILSLLPLRHQMAALSVCRRWQAVVRGLLARRREILLGRDYADAGDLAGLDSAGLRQILQLATGLQRLHTGPARLAPFETVDLITAHCPNLRYLDMSGVTFTCSHQKLRRLVRSCPLLEDVTLPSFYLYDELTVLLLLRHLWHLRRLQLPPGTPLTGQSLALLPDSMLQLLLPFCGGIESAHVRHVSRCHRLRELDLSGACRVKTEDLAAALAGCPRLQRLAVAKLSARPELYLPAEGLPELGCLDLEDGAGVTDGTLSRLPYLTPALVTLNIQGCNGVTEIGLCHLSHLGNLQSLDLGYLRSVSDQVLLLLRGLPLRELRLAQGREGPARFSVESVVSLAVGCPSLALLDLSCVDFLSEVLLEQLGRRLPDSRTLGVYVGGTTLERWPYPLYAGSGLCLLQYVTVPGGRRRLTQAQIWKEDDDEDEVPTIADWRHPPAPQD